GSAIKDKEGNVVGNHVKVKIVKNKLAPPFRISEFDIMYGEGISKVGEIVDLGVDHDIIQKSGAWYSYDSAKIAQGREAAKQFMRDNPEVALEIEQKVKNKITGVDEQEATADAGDAKGKSKKGAVKVSKD
ncbi:MAG: DNA recombination/repair protein RecA, partial [Phaeodactylibacter sp.]|nr:DNA recombination/repair protein RecA [Phaeodactylibacter sp.]